MTSDPKKTVTDPEINIEANLNTSPNTDATATSKKTFVRHWSEYLFTLLVGSMYIYAINRLIVSSTFLRTATPFRLYAMGMVALVFFMLIFYNRITLIISVHIVVLCVAVVLLTLERWEQTREHFYYVQLMIRGYMGYQPELGLTVLWAVSLLLGLVVAIFMHYRFSFYMLTIIGVAVFLVTWGQGASRDALSFLIFFLCFVLMLIRKTNNGITAVYIAAPICAALIFFVQGSVPTDAYMFQRRSIQDLFDGPLSAVSDFIYTLTNPLYFSFQTVGFTDQGGILGGPVTPNTRGVMTVQAPGRTYLSGLTNNVYTGYRWLSTLEHNQLYTQGMSPGRFEKLETTAALIRSASLLEYSATIPTMVLHNEFPDEESGRLTVHNFPALGILDHEGNDMYMHTYLPIAQAIVAIGSNRTGTVFRPQNSRQLWFHAAGPNYLPELIIDPTGDMRVSRFMSRGTQYTHTFLNIDHRLTFVEAIMNKSTPGVYATREPVELANVQVLPPGFIIEEDTVEGYLGENHIVTAEDINELFLMFSNVGPERSLYYVDSLQYVINMIDEFSRDVLSLYAQSVREHFMDVPDIVPQRVYELVHEIVYGLDTDFERVMAIRDYLIQFPYTLNPVPVPHGVCFVDHFLFEGQEGYCTYYATAMAIMSRIAGVPSRYVEGFLLPPVAGTDAAIFAVTNMMAHAWVEVYLEGFGWLIVEATAPYAFFIDQTLPIPRGDIHPYMFGHDWWLYLEYDMHHYLLGHWDVNDAPYVGAPVEAQGGETTGIILPGFVNAWNTAIMLTILLIVVVLIFLAWKYASVSRNAKRTKQLSINKQIEAYFSGIVSIASHCTEKKQPTETPYAYGQRVGKRFAFKSDSVMLRDLVALYYKARYSNRELTATDAKLMEDSYDDMMLYLRMANKQSDYLYLKYIRKIGACVLV